MGDRDMTSLGQPITFTYTNWRGETATRTAVPKSLWFGTTEWHQKPGWLMTAYDLAKAADRDFALADCVFRSSEKVTVPAHQAVGREVTAQGVALPEIAARWLGAYDASMSGTELTEEQREISQAIGLAACFAGAAHSNELSEGADVAALARAFLTALMDVSHPDLDYLRADPKAGQVVREVNENLRAIAEGGEADG